MNDVDSKKKNDKALKHISLMKFMNGWIYFNLQTSD